MFIKLTKFTGETIRINSDHITTYFASYFPSNVEYEKNGKSMVHTSDHNYCVKEPPEHIDRLLTECYITVKEIPYTTPKEEG